MNRLPHLPFPRNVKIDDVSLVVLHGEDENATNVEEVGWFDEERMGEGVWEVITFDGDAERGWSATAQRRNG